MVPPRMRKPHLFIQRECWPAACRDIKRQTSRKDFNRLEEVDLPVVLECQQQTKSLIEICQIWRIFLYLFCATLSTTDYSVHFWKAKCIVMTECFFSFWKPYWAHIYLESKQKAFKEIYSNIPKIPPLQVSHLTEAAKVNGSFCNTTKFWIRT